MKQSKAGNGGRLAFAEIGEDDAVALDDRIAALAHVLAKPAADRFGRRLAGIAP